MDGMGTVEGVIVLASTNRADILDKVRICVKFQLPFPFRSLIMAVTDPEFGG